MTLKLIYVMFANLLGWMVLRIRSDTTKVAPYTIHAQKVDPQASQLGVGVCVPP